MRPPDRAQLYAPPLPCRFLAPRTRSLTSSRSPPRSTSKFSFRVFRLDPAHDLANGFVDLFHVVGARRFTDWKCHQLFDSRKLASHFFDQRLVPDVGRDFVEL